jgi:hypothetical protein
MMAYDEQFVLCALHNGAPVREINGKVHLPFHSEYKVRLKNKHSFLRAKARVWIDGRQVSNLGDFVLQPNETLDLERFLDERMDKGRKFKFVPLSDGRVNDPTDEENGIIKVEFYREKRWDPPKFTIRSSGRGSSLGSGDANWVYNPTTTCFNSSQSSVNCSVNYLSSNTIADSFVPANAGATVEGGHSGQQFTYAADFETETYPVTLQIRVRGIDRSEVDWEDNPGTPGRPKKRIKFCPNCGAKRHGMSKFCASCGTAYHPRYERERGRIVR